MGRDTQFASYDLQHISEEGLEPPLLEEDWLELTQKIHLAVTPF